MRRAAWVACVALAVGLGACGGDDEDDPTPVPVATTTTPPAATQATVTTAQPEPEPEPERPRTADDRLSIPEPDLLGKADTKAIDDANEQLATVCDAVANGREPTETQVRDLATKLDVLTKIARAHPDGIWRPPLAPENERTALTAAEEAVEALRAGDCLPEFADTIERGLK